MISINRKKELLILTKNHYNQYSFDFDAKKRITYIHKSSIFKEFLKSISINDLIIDVGCGTGTILKSIIDVLPVFNVGIDLSDKSIILAQNKGLRNLIIGDNLNLPIKNNYFTHTISYGVIHHTPDAKKSFQELVRISRKNGILLISVYNKNHPYYFIYKIIGGIARTLRRNIITEFINRLILFPIFYLIIIIPVNVFILKNERWISFSSSWNIFNDQLLTPYATFHKTTQILKWAREKNCQVIKIYKEIMGQRITFLLKKM